MKRNLYKFSLFALLTLSLAGAAQAQDPMAMMMPGDEHKAFDVFVGDWNATIKTWIVPGGDPMVVEGVSSYEMVLGGRYLKQTLVAQMMGQPYEGVGMTGFDRWAKEYQLVWMDSMGTSMTTAKSKSAEEMTATMRNPMGGAVIDTRMTTEVVSDDKHVFTMYSPGPDGKQVKSLEITYTRK